MDKLPQEILCDILSRLAREDLIPLRLLSRAMAESIAPLIFRRVHLYCLRFSVERFLSIAVSQHAQHVREVIVHTDVMKKLGQRRLGEQDVGFRDHFFQCWYDEMRDDPSKWHDPAIVQRQNVDRQMIRDQAKHEKRDNTWEALLRFEKSHRLDSYGQYPELRQAFASLPLYSVSFTRYHHVWTDRRWSKPDFDHPSNACGEFLLGQMCDVTLDHDTQTIEMLTNPRIQKLHTSIEWHSAIQESITDLTIQVPTNSIYDMPSLAKCSKLVKLSITCHGWSNQNGLPLPYVWPDLRVFEFNGRMSNETIITLLRNHQLTSLTLSKCGFDDVKVVLTEIRAAKLEHICLGQLTSWNASEDFQWFPDGLNEEEVAWLLNRSDDVPTWQIKRYPSVFIM